MKNCTRPLISYISAMFFDRARTAAAIISLLLFGLQGCAQNAHRNADAQPIVPLPVAVQHAPLKNFCGINAYEWDFEDPANPSGPDEARLHAIENFTAVRHYLDWEKIEYTEGSYTFNPAHNGGWNYDTIYNRCHARHIEVLVCLKTIPKWMEDTYPTDQRNNENVPCRYGRNPSDPASYIEQARAAFQFAARYGSNKSVDRQLVKVNTTPRWTGDAINQVRIGLGTVAYLECDNERDKWWKGHAAQQSAEEYAANLSAFYDGDKGKLGPGVGTKTADPAMQVVMCGLARPDTNYLRGMIEWARAHRGYRKDGSIDLPWDIINYHYYCNDANGTNREQTTGVAPELTGTENTADAFITIAHEYAKDMPVWVTETGYDINPQSTQRAVPAAGQTALQAQAAWILRTSLLFSQTGVQKVFFYQLCDDNATSTIRYGTSGLVNADRTPRPAAIYLQQLSEYFGNYKYLKTISTQPFVDLYSDGKQQMFVLYSAVGSTSYPLDLGKADTAFVYCPSSGSTMALEKRKVAAGKVNIQVGATPLFVTSSEIIAP